MCDGHLEIPGIAKCVTDIWENTGIAICVTDIWENPGIVKRVMDIRKILGYEIV